MNNKMKQGILAVILLAGMQAMAAWTTTEEAASRLGAQEYKEIKFEKSSSSLTQAQKEEIKKTVADAKAKGKIDEVKILVWSDMEYPDTNNKQSKAEINLAKDRIRDLKAYLKNDLKVSSVDTFNMSERPNAIQKFFNTPDAKVKDATVAAGAAPTEANTGLFDMKAQASKGVIMVFNKK